jgi:hypothetical protein
LIRKRVLARQERFGAQCAQEHAVRFGGGSNAQSLVAAWPAPCLLHNFLAGDCRDCSPSGQQTSDETAIELTFWNTVKHTKDPAILQTYLDRYPNGAFAGLAQRHDGALGQGSGDEAARAHADHRPSAAT